MRGSKVVEWNREQDAAKHQARRDEQRREDGKVTVTSSRTDLKSGR